MHTNVFPLFTNYRVNLSVAIVDMTENKTIIHDDGTETYEQEFPWDSKQKGYVLSSFFYGYLCTQIIGGVLAAKIGGNLVGTSTPIEMKLHEI
jgi:MFS transporter, ACS family, solute carrier family 17 (sodium-dependent inorganic phosphate cotransporter), other